MHRALFGLTHLCRPRRRRRRRQPAVEAAPASLLDPALDVAVIPAGHDVPAAAHPREDARQHRGEHDRGHDHHQRLHRPHRGRRGPRRLLLLGSLRVRRRCGGALLQRPPHGLRPRRRSGRRRHLHRAPPPSRRQKKRSGCRAGCARLASPASVALGSLWPVVSLIKRGGPCARAGQKRGQEPRGAQVLVRCQCARA
ncbi:hypothetical protein SEVIR_9G128601v4 [Setaria viridis]